MPAVDFPYPSSPVDVPEGYTDYSDEYRSKQRNLTVGVVFFLLFYLIAVVSTFVLAVAGLILLGRLHIFAFLGALFFGTTFLFLVKGLFRSKQIEKDDFLEITDTDHPKLFGFLRQLCDEIGTDEPDAVFVAPGLEFMVSYRINLLSIAVKPKRDLILGVALINSWNLSEFKAVLGHEFGHFAQGTAAKSFFFVGMEICLGILKEDWFDTGVRKMKESQSALAIVGWMLWVPSAAFRFVVDKLFVLFATQRHYVAREGEFHADRVGASIAGSNAITHGLYRTDFAAETYGMAHFELLKAADHKLYTSDLYYHQHAAGDILRKKKKDPDFGRPPKLETPLHGKKVQVFDEASKDDHPDSDYHPANYDREEHVKKPFVAADEDERSAWILFNSPVELRERLTYKMYRLGKKIKKGTELDDPKVVQKFIDDEHEETTCDERYCGAYDGRYLNPGDLDELDELIRKEPWEDARLAAVYGKLYDDLGDKVEDRKDLLDELAALKKNTDGATSKRLRKARKKIERELDDTHDWFRTLDRRVYLVYMQMAYRIRNELYYDLFNRYRFHMAVQGIYKTATDQYDECEFYYIALTNIDPQKVGPDAWNEFFGEMLFVFREARSALKKLLREAREIDLPAMKHFDEGERLADFLLDEDLLREPGETRITAKWIGKLFRQIEQVQRKSGRLYFKSLGGMLAKQETGASQFSAMKGFVKAAPVVAAALPIPEPEVVVLD